jgi:ELWxxDGT repeat protein
MKRILLVGAISLATGIAQAQLSNQPFFTLMGDICTGGCNGIPQNITNCNGILYFAGNNDTTGSELYTSDGTPGGTKRVLNIAAGNLSSGPKNFTPVNGKVVFMANNGVNGYEPWVTDGTSTGTKMLLDINPGTAGQNTDGFTVLGSKAYFAASDATHGTELWVTDGTTAGTKMLMDIDPTASSYPSTSMAVYNSKLYFSATTNSDRELWVTDGTVAGTQLITDVNPNGASGPDNFTVYNSKLYFTAFTDTSGGELCVTDGTALGTLIITNLAAAHDSLPRALTISNNLLFFAAGTPLDSQTVWVTDGTVNNEHKLMTIATSYNDRQVGMLDNNGKLYFRGAVPRQTTQDVLWQTDGTVAGTNVVSTTLLSPGEMVSLKNEVYFICNNILYNTPNAINVQAVPLPSTFNGTVRNLPMTAMGNAIYMAANYESFYGDELWKMELVPTGVNDINNSTDIVIYPNPADNSFSVKTNNSTNTTVKIFSLTGQLLLQTQETRDIDIQHLPAGTYIVHVESDNKASIGKLVKE